MTTHARAEATKKGALVRSIEWVVRVDVDAAQTRVADLRGAYPHESAAGLAAKVYEGLAWKAALTGVVAAVPNNPLAALPASSAEVLWLLRKQVQTAAEVALIFDPHFFDHPDAGWSLLVPVLGVSALSGALKEAGIAAGRTASKRVITKKLRGSALRAFKRVVLKTFGKKITKKAILTKTVPIVGALIGGTWNFAEVKVQKRRVLAYFAGEGA